MSNATAPATLAVGDTIETMLVGKIVSAKIIAVCESYGTTEYRVE